MTAKDDLQGFNPQFCKIILAVGGNDAAFEQRLFLASPSFIQQLNLFIFLQKTRLQRKLEWSVTRCSGVGDDIADICHTGDVV